MNAIEEAEGAKSEWGSRGSVDAMRKEIANEAGRLARLDQTVAA